MNKYVIDTNSLINNPEIMEKYEVVITSIVLREIEQLERRKMDSELQYKIRNAKRKINGLLKEDKIEIVDVDGVTLDLNYYDDDYADNKIIAYAVGKGYSIITEDILLKFKANSFNVKTISSIDLSGNKNKDYEGLLNFYYDSNNEDDLELMEKIQVSANHKLEMAMNPFFMKTNQYLIVWDVNQREYREDGFGENNFVGYKDIATYRFNGKRLVNITFKDLKSRFSGKVKPKNVRQRLAFDMLQNEDISVKLLSGKFGSGKDYLMLSHAIDLVEEGKFDKIVWVRNNIEVKNTNPIGFLPDSLENKLRPFLAPLQDFLGGEVGLDRFIAEGKVEIQNLSFIRGRDIKNAIIYVTECQSNTKEHVQLLLGRVGKDSQIWFNGDQKQTDAKVFEYNNGIQALSQLAGHNLYGHVTFDKTERSETANLAGLLDDI